MMEVQMKCMPIYASFRVLYSYVTEYHQIKKSPIITTTVNIGLINWLRLQIFPLFLVEFPSP